MVLKRGFALILIMFCLNITFGQDIRNHYVSRAQEDGTVFFANPVELFESKEHGTLKYDLTYKTGSDSVVMNFTYILKRAVEPDSIRVKTSTVDILGTTRKIYVEPKSNKDWAHRYSTSGKINDFYKLYDNDGTDAEVVIYSSGKEYTFPAKQSAWSKYSPIGYKIFETIRLNNR